MTSADYETCVTGLIYVCGKKHKKCKIKNLCVRSHFTKLTNRQILTEKMLTNKSDILPKT